MKFKVMQFVDTIFKLVFKYIWTKDNMHVRVVLAQLRHACCKTNYLGKLTGRAC